VTALSYAELTRWGLLRFSGADASGFLHGQLTCDVTGLPSGAWVHGSYCTPQGRILATFLLWRDAEDWVMQLSSTLHVAVRDRLAKYVLRSRVKIEDATPDWTIAGLAGDAAEARVAAVLGAAPGTDRGVEASARGTVLRLAANRYEVLVPADGAATLHALAEGAQRAAPDYWDWLDIRAGVAVVTPPTQEQFVPQMVNLDLVGGVSLNKGCYPGQEIVARMHYLGRLKQRTYLAHIAAQATDAAPAPGDKLYSAQLDGQASGTIVNAAPAPDGGYDALAVIQIAATRGHTVHWKRPDGPVLTLLPLPYGVPEQP